MVLALFGKGYWFLAAASVGTPAFFLTLVVVAFFNRLRGAGRIRSGTGQSTPESAR
jgi:hypothetical protein